MTLIMIMIMKKMKKKTRIVSQNKKIKSKFN